LPAATCSAEIVKYAGRLTLRLIMTILFGFTQINTNTLALVLSKKPTENRKSLVMKLWTLRIMEQSIRNEIPGTVKEIISDKVLSEIIIETAIGEVVAIITTRSVQDMGLKVGDRVAALVKATNVSVRRQG
jgi:molybdopterin-binding protein